MLRCTRPDCRRAGPDVGNCADKALGCPPFREVGPHKDVVIHCRSCKLTRAVPAGELMMAHKNPFGGCLGNTDGCKAVPVLPEAAPKKKA